jgi:predicted dienelactone hydrolase
MKAMKPALLVALVSILVLCFALAIACGDDDDDNDDENDDDADDDDDDDDDAKPYFPPDERGAYEVGVTTTYLVDEDRFETWGNRNRVLPLEIWYPSTGIGGTPNTMPDMIGELPGWVVSLLELVFGDNFDDLWSATTSALRDAEPLMSDTQYPVLFFSHGFMGLRFQNYTMSEHLASHGIVVVAVDHYGNAVFANLAGLPGGGLIPYNPTAEISYEDRVEDVAFVYRELEAMNEDAMSSWYGLLDLENFAVSGHSMGGMTSLLCGAEFDFVKAIAPLNPSWSGEFPQSFTKPFFMLQGELDASIGQQTNEAAKLLLENAASDRKVHINVLRGGHFSTTDVCTLVPPNLTSLVAECVPPYIDLEQANLIISAYLTAFLKPSLAGDDRYGEYLMSNHFPDEIELIATWQ